MTMIADHEHDTAATPGDDEALRALTQEVRSQGRSIRATQHAFMVVAGLALVIAMANLIAVAAKLDQKAPAAAAPAAAAPTAAAPKAAAPLPSRVAVGLREFTVTPSATTAAAGRVTFAARNTGKVTHELVVIRTDKPAGALMKGSRADESGNVGESGDLKPGAGKTFAITLKPGHYALICNLPGHYAAGQHTDFSVRG